jgi:hypothetical protein
MSRQTQLFAQDGKLTVKAPPPELDTPTKRMREGAVEEMAKAWSDRLHLFKKQRQTYTEEQKLTMCELLVACHGNVSQACEVAHECGITINWHTMKRSTQDTGQRGRPVNAEFERAVLSKCIFQILSGDSLQSEGRILANILHSLNTVIMAGHSTIAEQPFATMQACANFSSAGVGHVDSGLVPTTTPEERNFFRNCFFCSTSRSKTF